MNTAGSVDARITEMKAAGIPLSDAAWEAALMCVGWPYVFGGRGEYCTPANRRVRYNDTKDGKDKENIKAKCKNFSGEGTCSGCQWYPEKKRTRFFDCRGFTYWILKEVYNGWELMGAGATSQWNTASNWKAKGTIDTMPKDTLVCLFVQKGQTMEHTGFGLNNETVECSSGVQHFSPRKNKWTHWGVPVCVEETVQAPEKTDQHDGFPENTGWRPTIRRGSKGDVVTECQTMLVKLGYDIGPCGIDGDFGRATMAAVKEFQRDHQLTIDGVVGVMTWDALDKAVRMINQQPVKKTYTVTIRGLDEAQAQALAESYQGSEIRED